MKPEKPLGRRNHSSPMEYLLNKPPEYFAPSILEPHKRKVLLLASYCGDDYPDECSEECPCNECLRMCNVAEVVVSIGDVVGELGTKT